MILLAVDMRKREQQCATAAEICSSLRNMSTNEVMKVCRGQALMEVALGKRRKARTGLVLTRVSSPAKSFQDGRSSYFNSG